MFVLEALFAEARDAHTLWVVAGLIVTSFLVQRDSGEGRARRRTITIFSGLHLLLALIAGLNRAFDAYAYTTFHLTAQALAAVAGVGMAILLTFGGLLPRLGMRPPRILGDLVGGAALLVVLMALASSAGFNLSGVIATSAVLTAVIGLALQDTLGNLVGGLALQFDKSIGVGDWVRFGDLYGKVVDIRWRYTALETRNWETLIVPNGQLVKTAVLVLGRRVGEPELWRRTVTFQVDYRHPPREVIAAVEEGMRASPITRVAEKPPPHVLFFDYTEGYARYAVRYWLDDIDVDDPVDSDVRVRIFNSLERAGLVPAVPSATRVIVHEEDRRQEDATREREARLRAISGTDLFVHLVEDDRRELADALRAAPFSAGEVITRQGTEAHWLFLLASGHVSVRVSVEGGLEHEVNRLGPGSFFGEMSLMTGAPRAATVVALTDVVCYRLHRTALEPVLRRRPALARDIAAVLARRRAQLDDMREDLDALARERRSAESENVLVSRIRQFFGLDDD